MARRHPRRGRQVVAALIAVFVTNIAHAQAPSAEQETELVAAPIPAPPPPARFRGALETVFESFPSGTVGGTQDFFSAVTPILGFSGGDDFGLELGAQLRFRLLDGAPSQRASDYGGILRREDWDERSDYGQILRQFKAGTEGGTLWLRAGPAQNFSLGRGHLVNRYSNRDNPNYHPLSASLNANFGAMQANVFASDVFAGRLFAAELSADLAALAGGKEESHNRYHLSLSAAHDHALAGGSSPRITAMHVDASLAVFRNASLQAFFFAGFGTRLLIESVDVGALAGLSLDGAVSSSMRLGGKFELRKQNGGFRQGLFGAGYELSRFAGMGFSGIPLAAERIPDGYSGYGELRLGSGVTEETVPTRLSFSAAFEQFSWGRADADASMVLSLFDGKGTAAARWIATGLGMSARHLFGAEVRYRFAPAFYALATGGTVFFPQANSTLHRGVFAGLGVGADFER